MNEMILVSACLLGLNTRYNAEPQSHPDVMRFLQQKRYTPIPICPEQLAGLPTPRPSVSFTSGDGDSLLDGEGNVCAEDGTRLNEIFTRGAQQTLLVARLTGCSRALLKERSPSCGCNKIYRNGSQVSGRGVTSALLQRHAITVFSEEEL